MCYIVSLVLRQEAWLADSRGGWSGKMVNAVNNVYYLATQRME